MVQLEPKQSKLDYLWVNFGEKGVATSLDSATQESIPSYGLIQELLSDISSNAVGSITEKNGTLIVKSLDGVIMNTIDLSIGAQISKFGRRIISKKDIENGSPYLLYQPVYFILLDNGVELVAPIDVYKGDDGKVIKTKVVDNIVYADLKISPNFKGIVFTKEEDGLAGYVQLKGSNKGIQFEVMDQFDYEHSIHDAHTLYFINGQSYMYFGDTKIGNNPEEDFTQFENRLSRLENLIDWENHG